MAQGAPRLVPWVEAPITHTAGVFALGFVTLALSRYVLPEQLYPWLSAASGVLVVVIGLSLARRRLFRDAPPCVATNTTTIARPP